MVKLKIKWKQERSLEKRGRSRKKDLQLYKIHKSEKYKDTTEKWLVNSVPNTQRKQNQNG